MQDKRSQPREELVAAMICSVKIGSRSTYCLIRNISIGGALLECPMAEDYGDLEIGDGVVLSDILPGSKALFDESRGEIAWLYRRFVGVRFIEPVMDSAEGLREWLESQQLV